MAEKIKVSAKLAEKVIQEKINELKKKRELKYEGNVSIKISGSSYKLKSVGTIYIHLNNEDKPFNEPFEILGSTKLIYENDENHDTIDDGPEYCIRAEATLKDENGYLMVILSENKIIITDHKY